MNKRQIMHEFDIPSCCFSRISSLARAGNGSDSTGASYRETIDLGDGEICVGQIKYKKSVKLRHSFLIHYDRNCVFLGSIKNRKVAVKRVDRDCYKLIDYEVALLRESDEHENVVRYFCTEQDRNFRYIAMELCAGTLEDYVKCNTPSEVLAATTVKVLLREKIARLDILRQVTEGLKHLHALGIVHRDIKPQNILLSLPDNLGCVLVKISDFGLKKNLNYRKESSRKFAMFNINLYSKYRAPEIRRGQRATKSADIFSLGCVFYYVLTDGFHLFRSWDIRQWLNILSDKFDLGMMGKTNLLSNNQSVLAEELIRDMIQIDGSKRPSARAIGNHPLFWYNNRVLDFLLDVSERVEKLEIMVEPLYLLESTCLHVILLDWMHYLRTESKLMEDLGKFRNYQKYSVRDLLRALRDMKHHYLELTPESQRALGTIPHEFTDFWIKRFPRLLSHCYHALANNSREPMFLKYYYGDEANHIGGEPPVGPHGGYKFTKPTNFLLWDDNDNDELEQDMKTGTKTGTATGPGGGSYSKTIDLGDGEMCVGNIRFNKQNVLGKGCEETFVFLGSFVGRKAAVKRIVANCFKLADREVAALCDSDEHENVVRYFCYERDQEYQYIAIELCAATLQHYVEDKEPPAVPAATTVTVSLLRQKISPLDILRQATQGLMYLQGLGIVHRDIKPQNILLSLPDNLGCVRVKISDFGLSKKLNNGKESLTQNSGVTGTNGWIAPEMLLGQRVTMSVDIFSLGCVFYYVLSCGCHPFGDSPTWQANILLGKVNLGGLRPKNTDPDNQTVLAEEIIRDMIQSDGSKRPSARAIVNHPLFWDNDRVLAFLLVVSERVEKSTPMDEPLRSLEKNAHFVVRVDWMNHLDLDLTADLRKFRDYQGYSVSHLLRAIRNKKSHYLELPPELQRALGTIPHEFMNNWISRFPHLISHTYHAMADISSEHSFREYYDEAVGPHGGYKFTPPSYFQRDDNDNDELIRYYERQQEKKKNSGNNSTKRRR